MSIKPFLGTNTGVQDIFFFGTQLSPFAYKGWTTSTNFLIERKDYDPINTTAFNQTITFQYPNDTDLAGPPAIVIQLPAIDQGTNSAAARGATSADGATTGTQTTLTNHRYIDGAGLHIIEKIDITYGSNLLQTIKPEDIEIRANLYEQTETLQYTQELMGFWGNDITHSFDRGTTASDTLLRTYIIHLPMVFWGLSPNQWLPVFMLKDINNLRIQVKLKDWASIVTATGGASGYLSQAATGVVPNSQTPLSVRLRAVNVHLTAVEKQYFVDLLRSTGTAEGVEDDGILYKFTDIERHEREPVVSGTTSKSLRLSNFHSPTTQIYFILRPQRRVDAKWPYAPSTTVLYADLVQDPTQASYQQIGYNKLTANGMDLLREQSWRDTTLSDMLLFYPNGFKKQIYVRVFNDLTPTDDLNCVGSINFLNLNNPQLELRFLSAVSGDHYLDVYAKVHMIIQMVNGQLHRLFN